MSLQAFEAQLRRHDWYYEMSDDHQDFQDGANNYSRLYNIAAVSGTPFQRLLNQIHDEMYDEPTFGVLSLPFPSVSG